MRQAWVGNQNTFHTALMRAMVLLGCTQPEPHHTVVAVHTTGNVHQQQAILFEARRALLGAKAQALDRAGDVVIQDRQLQRRGVDREPLAGHVAGRKAILEFVVGVFDGAGFPAVPLHQADSVLFQVADQRAMVAIEVVGCGGSESEQAGGRSQCAAQHPASARSRNGALTGRRGRAASRIPRARE